MARVNIDDDVWTDDRFTTLGRILGGSRLNPVLQHALGLGVAAKIWRRCIRDGASTLTFEAVAGCTFLPKAAQAMVDSGLAERTANGIRVRGATDGRVGYMSKLKENSRKGGEATRAKFAARSKANRPCDEGGQEALGKQGPPTPTPTPTPTPANTHTRSRSYDLEAVYAAYPKKVGKKPGLTKLKACVKDDSTYELVLAAARDMGKLWRGHDLQYCPGFAAWVNQERWLDDVLPTPRRNDSRPSGQQERLPVFGATDAGGAE